MSTTLTAAGMSPLAAALRALAPGMAPGDVAAWEAALAPAMDRFVIDTPLRRAHFLAQCATESGRFRALEENLLYTTPERIRAVWPSRFPTVEAARPFARNPRALASRVYSGRNGNGDEASGDGFAFRGRGAIQITGRANYTRFASAVARPLAEAVEWCATREGAAMSAAWFWADRRINSAADRDDVEAVTRLVNGGLNGIEDRRALLAAAKGVLLGGARFPGA